MAVEEADEVTVVVLAMDIIILMEVLGVKANDSSD